MLKRKINLEEIDPNSDLWDSIVWDLQNGFSNLENEVRFAFQTEDKKITEDDINALFWDKYEYADQINVEEVEIDDGEQEMRYFGVSMILYKSGICEL